MTYLRPYNQHKSHTRRIYAGVIVVVIFVVGVIQGFAPHIFPAFFMAIANPFWRLEVSIQSGAFRSPAQILRENLELKMKLSDYEARNASSTIALFENQNKELLALYGRAASSSVANLSLAAVLSHSSGLPYNEITIDLGRKNNVSTTSLVYAFGNILIGRIVDVQNTTSRVLLYSSPKQSLEVQIGATRIPAIALGRGFGQYETEVPHGSGVVVGDAVVASGLHNRAFGEVVSVLSDPANPFDKILFAPPINVADLNFVLVDTRKSGSSRI